MTIAPALPRSNAPAPQPVRISATPCQSAGEFARRCLAFANRRNVEVRGRFGALEFTANPGDPLSRVLAPFYQSARW